MSTRRDCEQVIIRRAGVDDTEPVMDIIRRTDFFRDVEEDIALEVLEEAAEARPECSYQSYVGMVDGKVAGWVCFGVTPCTLGTFDIYWIAVDPDVQRCGVGKKLLRFAEQEIISQKGRLVVIETSGSQKYASTQGFYERCGYRLAARVEEFYAPGDDKLIFIKTV